MIDLGLTEWQYFEYVSHPFAQTGILIVLSLLAATILNHLGTNIIRRTMANSKYDFSGAISDELDGVIFLTVAGLGIRNSLTPISLPEWLISLVGSSIVTLLVLVWARALLRIGNAAQDQTDPTPGKNDFIPIFANIWTVIVMIGGAFVLLGTWGINLTPLLASAGVMGAIAGFAARDAVANFFGSLALYFDDTYKIGDYLRLESGEEGWVTDITIRSTVLRTLDDELVTVPNSKLNSTVILNQSEPGRPLRVPIKVGVAYGTDIDLLEDILLDIAENHEDVETSPQPRVRFREFGDSALIYHLLIWSPRPGAKVRQLRHELNQRIYKRLDEEDIEIPFPQRDIHFQQDPAPESVGGSLSDQTDGGK